MNRERRTDAVRKLQQRLEALEKLADVSRQAILDAHDALTALLRELGSEIDQPTPERPSEQKES